MKTIVLALVLLSQSAESIQRGQSVYIVAVKTTGQQDISTESKIKEEFTKQKAFKVATSLQSADFVFLMRVEYEYNQAAVAGIGVGSEDIKSVAALAVSREAYTQHKSSLDELRDKALWQLAEIDILST